MTLFKLSSVEIQIKPLIIAFVVFISCEASASNYWDFISESIKDSPSSVLLSRVEASSDSLIGIEKANRSPIITGGLSRVDGASSLSETSDAYQASIDLSYTLYDNGIQDFKDIKAHSQAALEIANAAVDYEEDLVDASAAYIDYWAASRSIVLLNSALVKVANLRSKIEIALSEGEATVNQLYKLEEYELNLKASLLDAESKKSSSEIFWQSINPKEHQWVLPDPNEVLSYTLSDNLNVHSLRSQLSIVNANKGALESEGGLQLGLSVSALQRYYSSGDNGTNLLWSLNATYPLFDGGRLEAKVYREALTASTIEQQLKVALENQLRAQRRLSQYISSKVQLVSSKADLCDKQQEMLNNTQERYDIGRGNVEQLLESALSASNCQNSLISERADLYHALNEYSKTVGYLVSKYVDLR